jgi:hypothetical protein
MLSRSRAQSVLAEADRLTDLLQAAAGSELSAGGPTVEYAEELVAAIRADRDGR